VLGAAGVGETHATACPARASSAHLFFAGFCSSHKWSCFSVNVRRLAVPSRSDLVTHAPPIYIQEKVKPKVLIDDLLRRSAAGLKAAEDQYDLFADFNAREPEQVKAFRDTWRDGVHSYLTYLYFVRAKNIAGTTDSNTVSVSVPANICQASPYLPTIQSLTIVPTSVAAGSSAAVTITLSSPAPSSGAIISLSSSNANFSVPLSFTVPAGQSSATFSAQSNGSITLTATTTVTATYNNSSQNASVTITVTAAGLPTLIGISISPSTVTSGSNATLLFTLSGPAPSSGAVIGLSANNSGFPVPSSFTVPAGQSSASFSAQSSVAITATTTTTVTATYNNGSQSTTVTVTPSTTALTLSSVSISPSSLASGTFATLSVTINGKAPAGGTAVGLQSSNPTAFPVPSTITVPSGQSTNGVSVQAGAVNRQQL
jgi:hypothetical protein